MIAISLAALGLLLATIPSVTSVPLLVVVISVIAVFVQLYFAPLFAASRRTFGSRLAGLSTGFGNFCANLGGFAAILGLGILRDATGSFSVGFYCLAGVALIGLVATALLSRQPAAGVRDGSG
jgi:nitrate/nitrite transporter NarK